MYNYMTNIISPERPFLDPECYDLPVAYVNLNIHYIIHKEALIEIRLNIESRSISIFTLR